MISITKKYEIFLKIYSHRDFHCQSYIYIFYQGFLSWTLTTHRAAGEGGRSSFIQLYHFHPLTNIQTFICKFQKKTQQSLFLWIWFNYLNAAESLQQRSLVLATKSSRIPDTLLLNLGRLKG